MRIRHELCALGPKLMCAVDGPNVIEHYDGLFAAMRGRADLLVFEPPGTGGSAPPRGFDFSVGAFVRVTEDLLAEHGRRTLVFPCYLGLIARVVAERSPDRVAAIVTPQSPTARAFAAWSERVDPKRILRTRGVGQVFVALRKRQVAEQWFRYTVGHRETLQTVIGHSRANLKGGGHFCLASLMQGMERTLIEASDPRVLQPSATIWGAKDRSYPAPPPDVTELFEGSGHSPELEEPERFTSWLLGWHP
jgi:pimeloyl-ACP methyl ester carboxylesterase